MTATLQAQVRTERGKRARALRARGVLPAVLYGPKEDSAALSLSLREFEKVFKEAGESTVITLTGLDEDKDVLVQDIAYDPVTSAPLHVDLYAIEKGKKVTVNVPLEFVGEAPVVKLGGLLTKVLHELEIEAMPKDLPHQIEVDVSSISDFDSQITVAEIVAPAGVSILNDPEEVVVVAEEAKEEAEAPVEQVDMDAIEVEEKGKKEGEEGENEAKSEE
ncbi:50S ribosomal protein L25 [Candidatus Kaiserbacteria bacterium]|nr:50S ribosomal protein L25 [Candidatus Kaiserbacteria bacterium]